MIDARDLWAALAAGAPSARVVVRLADGTEVDVASVACYCQLVVIQTDEPLHTPDTALEEALERAEGDGPVTPEQITDLLDAHSGTIDECTALLEELEERGITTRGQLIAVLDLAADIDGENP